MAAGISAKLISATSWATSSSAAASSRSDPGYRHGSTIEVRDGHGSRGGGQPLELLALEPGGAAIAHHQADGGRDHHHRHHQDDQPSGSAPRPSASRPAGSWCPDNRSGRACRASARWSACRRRSRRRSPKPTHRQRRPGSLPSGNSRIRNVPVARLRAASSHDASTAVISAGICRAGRGCPRPGTPSGRPRPSFSPIASSSRLITPPRPLIAISRPTAAKLSSASTKMALNR